MSAIAGILIIILAIPIGWLLRPKTKDEARVWLLVYSDMIGVVIGLIAIGLILILL